jgi:hypothetical protein
MAEPLHEGGSCIVACAASLMLFLGACSTAEQAASPGIDQAGFAHPASTEKSAEPPVVTAGELVQQKEDNPAAPQRDDNAQTRTQSGFDLSASQVAALIAHSRAEFSGECPCPYDRDKSGRSCGKRSAYSSGGSAVLCYPKDVIPQ